MGEYHCETELFSVWIVVVRCSELFLCRAIMKGLSVEDGTVYIEK